MKKCHTCIWSKDVGSHTNYKFGLWGLYRPSQLLNTVSTRRGLGEWHGECGSNQNNTNTDNYGELYTMVNEVVIEGYERYWEWRGEREMWAMERCVWGANCERHWPVLEWYWWLVGWSVEGFVLESVESCHLVWSQDSDFQVVIVIPWCGLDVDCFRQTDR